jgi:tetratricopeptide (TPR) repeat protein
MGSSQASPNTSHDVFISYAHADAAPVLELVSALKGANIRVWLDESEIPTFAAISQKIAQGLANAKAFLAYYSKTYPTRRACQYELTSAFVTAQALHQGFARLLVVNPESSDAHIQPIELRNTKYLSGLSTSAAFTAAAATIAAHLATLSGPFGEVTTLAPPPWYPSRGTGSTRFVGRVDKMWEVHSSLQDDQAPFAAKRISPGIAQIAGLGGVGKSLLAEEYALRFGAAYPGGIFWLRALGSDITSENTATRLEPQRIDQFSAIATQLNLPQTNSPAVLESNLRDYFQKQGRSGLWIVDDIPAGLPVDQLRTWFAPHPILKTLFTTRSREYGAVATRVDLASLPEADAYTLLTSQIQPHGAEEESAAHATVQSLGAHALAIDVAGAALANYESQQPFQAFLRELSIPNQDSLELAADLADALPSGHERSIAATLLGGIRAASEPARTVLRLASLLASAPIPELLLVTIPDFATGAFSKDRANGNFRLAARDLQRYSLAEKSEGGALWLVHPLIVRTIRYSYAKDGRTEALRQPALQVLNRWLSDRASQELPATDELAHARKLAADGQGISEINLLQQVARLDESRGSYKLAEAEWREILARLPGLPSQSEEITLAMQNNLAVTLRKAGDGKQARDIQTAIVKRKTALFGLKNPSTIQSIDNLGATLAELGDFSAAINTHHQAVELYSEVLGPEHKDTMVAVANWASALRRGGRLREAFEINSQLLNVRTKVLGPNDPATLRTAEAASLTLSELGHPADAIPSLRSIANGFSQLRGADDPMTLSVRNSLALALLDAGGGEEARAILEEVLASRQHVLGPTHPHTLVTLETLCTIEPTPKFLFAAADALQQLDSSFGSKDPRTTEWAWSHYKILNADPAKRSEATQVIDKYLVWLLSAPSENLEAVQITVLNKFASTPDGIFRALQSKAFGAS